MYFKTAKGTPIANIAMYDQTNNCQSLNPNFLINFILYYLFFVFLYLL